jgi:lysophospholipase L1-like esterase
MKPKLLWLLFVLLLILAGLEAGLRVFPLENKRTVWNHWIAPENAAEFNQRYAFSEDIGYEKLDVSKNILNVGRENPIILVLGDSVAESGSFPKYIADTLNVTVVNAGVMGYDTEMEYRYLKFRAMGMRPDLVVLQLNPNDFDGTPIILKKPDGSWEAFERRSLQERISPWLFENSMIYRNLKIFKWSRQRKDEQFKISTVEEPLIRIRALLKETPLLIVVFPCLGDAETSANYLDLTQKVIEETHSENITLFLQIPVNESIDPWHPNEKGQRIAGEAIATRIELLSLR